MVIHPHIVVTMCGIVSFLMDVISVKEVYGLTLSYACHFILIRLLINKGLGTLPPYNRNLL